MNRQRDRFRHVCLLLVFCCTMVLSYGCATTPAKQGGDLPPILKQDELLRPYVKVGVINVQRERYGSPEDFSPADFDWGFHALREEAAKVGADAVILPEVRAQRQKNYIFFPSSDITAKGIAIKFR